MDLYTVENDASKLFVKVSNDLFLIMVFIVQYKRLQERLLFSFKNEKQRFQESGNTISIY